MAMISSIRLENFKAIQDSQVIRFTPLTTPIGYNGSGKSSVVEGLETLQHIVRYGLDAAMQDWRGFEHIWNQHTSHKARKANQTVPWPHHTNPMRFNIHGRTKQGAFVYKVDINMAPSGDHIFIQDERTTLGGKVIWQNIAQLFEGKATIAGELKNFISAWQFLDLVPQGMGQPVPQTRTAIANAILTILDETDRRTFERTMDNIQYSFADRDLWSDIWTILDESFGQGRPTVH